MTNTRAFLIGIVAAVAFLAAFVLVPLAITSAHQRSDIPRVCFPAAKWDAADRNRPCAYIRLYEDGTFRSHVTQADGDPWVQR